MKIIVRAIKCKHCGESIYSRSHYDMNYCKCRELAIDGGTSIMGDSVKNNPSYLRIKGKDYENVELVFGEFNSRKELRLTFRNDYSKQTNKYGRV